MFHKFKMTASVTLLLIGVFVLPYAGNVTADAAEKYGCSWDSKKILAKCLKEVIADKEEQIRELQSKLRELSPIEAHEAQIERRSPPQGGLLATPSSPGAVAELMDCSRTHPSNIGDPSRCLPGTYLTQQEFDQIVQEADRRSPPSTSASSSSPGARANQRPPIEAQRRAPEDIMSNIDRCPDYREQRLQKGRLVNSFRSLEEAQAFCDDVPLGTPVSSYLFDLY